MTRHAIENAGGRGGRLPRWGRGAALALVLIVGLLSPSAARAEEEDEAPDGRLEGYPTKVAYEKSSTVLTWFLFFILLVVGLTSLFKTAKRE